MAKATSSDISALTDIMQQLRDPETGCPWDIKQNFQSIAPYTIEEAYEVADAIERDNMDDLKDELGDLLLQVVFHSQMAKEAEQFTIDDVVKSVCDKMIRRHPHIFGDTSLRDEFEVKGLWEKIKAEERASKNNENSDQLLMAVPSSLPGLMRAQKLQKKAATVGFDWPHVNQIFDKFKEELQELETELTAKPESGSEVPCTTDKQHQERLTDEVGDLLFCIVNLARHLNVDADSALRKTNQKFTRRFNYIEQRAKADSRKLEELSLDEMETLWQAAKTNESI